jgi:hypothetical protein
MNALFYLLVKRINIYFKSKIITNMKFYLPFLFLCISFSLFSQNGTDSTFFTYKLEKYQIKLPSDWLLDDSENEEISFIIYAPAKSGKEKILPNISANEKELKSQIGSNFTSAEQYVKSYESLMSLAHEGFVMLESKKNVNGSYSITYTSLLEEENGDKIKIKTLETYFFKDKIIYIVSYKASIEDFESELNTAKMVISSFLFVK